MQYYIFKLDKESQDLFVNIAPYGKSKYKHLPMGLKCALDFAQQIMKEVLLGLDNVEVYLDNIGMFANTWEDLLLFHNKVLSCFEANGFTANPLKCKWAVQEMDWLGYWLTPTGLKPWKKHISSILEQDLPRMPSTPITSCGLNMLTC